MENAVEALKIAFAVLLFVLALTLSMSCFSQATSSVTAIVNMRDRDRQILYDQIKPSNGLTRTVGVETIVPALYTAYEQNIKVYFKKSNGDSIPIYYKTNEFGKKVLKNDGSYEYETIDFIDLAEENFKSDGIKSAEEIAKEHLSIILAGNSYVGQIDDKYVNQIYYANGFYDYLKDGNKKFEEHLGEYYQGSNTSTAIKKRVITYTLVE